MKQPKKRVQSLIPVQTSSEWLEVVTHFDPAMIVVLLCIVVGIIVPRDVVEVKSNNRKFSPKSTPLTLTEDSTGEMF